MPTLRFTKKEAFPRAALEKVVAKESLISVRELAADGHFDVEVTDAGADDVIEVLTGKGFQLVETLEGV